MGTAAPTGRQQNLVGGCSQLWVWGKEGPGFLHNIEERLTFLYTVIEDMQLGNSRHQAVSNSSVYSQSSGMDGSHRGTVPWDSSCGVPQLAQLGESSEHSGSCMATPPEVTSSGCHGNGQLLLVNIPKL